MCISSRIARNAGMKVVRSMKVRKVLDILMFWTLIKSWSIKYKLDIIQIAI